MWTLYVHRRIGLRLFIGYFRILGWIGRRINQLRVATIAGESPSPSRIDKPMKRARIRGIEENFQFNKV